MSGKLIIQSKAWGEFESAKRSKGNIEISGYRSYGGTHTVRMVDQPQLNENQQNVLLIMKNIQKRWPHFHPSTVVDELIGLESEYHDALSKTEELQVFKIFMIWALEQEEK